MNFLGSSYDCLRKCLGRVLGNSQFCFSKFRNFNWKLEEAPSRNGGEVGLRVWAHVERKVWAACVDRQRGWNMAGSQNRLLLVDRIQLNLSLESLRLGAYRLAGVFVGICSTWVV